MKKKKNGFMALIAAMVILCSFFGNSYAQTFAGITIPPEVLAPNLVTQAESDRQVGKSDGYYFIENALPTQYVRDGSVDYTVYVQNALNAHRNVIFPAFPILVSVQNSNGTVLSISSNSNLVFPKGSKLILAPNSVGDYYILKMDNVENINVHFPVIVGDRISHTGTSGESGIGISMRAARNIYIRKPYVTKCWGDGIYVGALNATTPLPKNIVVNRAVLDSNRRNGLSIVCGDSIIFNNLITANTYGTSPRSGIDIEPNRNTEACKTIILRNVISHNNHTSGLDINLGRLRGVLPHDDINIKINGLKMTGYSAYPLTFTLNKNIPNSIPLGGRISIRGVTLENYYKPYLWYDDPYNNTPTCVTFGYAPNKEALRARFLDSVKNKPNYFVGCGGPFGSTVFQQLSAASSNNQLAVNWATIPEANILRYEVEASKDKLNFTKIGELNSKIVIDDAEELLQYTFTMKMDGITGLAGIAIITLMMFSIRTKKKQLLMTVPILFLVATLFNISCNKREMMNDHTNEKTGLYIRVAQVDIYGEKEYSDIVEVTKQ